MISRTTIRRWVACALALALLSAAPAIAWAQGMVCYQVTTGLMGAPMIWLELEQKPGADGQVLLSGSARHSWPVSPPVDETFAVAGGLTPAAGGLNLDLAGEGIAINGRLDAGAAGGEAQVELTGGSGNARSFQAPVERQPCQ